MKVQLINPPYSKDRIFRKSLKDVGALLPPLGISYIAAVLESEGHEVQIIDGCVLSVTKGYDFDDLSKDVEKFQPDIVGVTATTPQINLAFETMKKVKSVSHAVTFLGGPHVTALPSAITESKFCDYGVYGEGENSFKKIVERMTTKKSFKKVKGLIIKNKTTVKLSQPEYINDLDSLPFPAWHLLPMKLYRPSPANYRKLPALQIMTSRGCPFKCAFCCKPIFGFKFRAHSPGRVISEIEHLIATYGIKDLEVFDDTFTFDKKRAETICNMIIEKKLDIGWNCMTRVDCVSPELLKIMASAGCYQVGYGIESGSPKIQQRMNKMINLEKVRQAVGWANDAGIDIRAFFMFAFPGETVEDAKMTIEFAKTLDIDVAQFMVTTPYPGTPLWSMAHEEGKLQMKDWENFTFYAPEGIPYIPEGRTEKEVLETYSRAFKEFYLRPRYFLRQLMKIRSPTDISRYLVAVKSVLNI